MPVLKAQHPEFEVWSQGVHARAGVACADCHMPYKREGAMKVSEHWVRSPLLMINRSCQPCHSLPRAGTQGTASRPSRIDTTPCSPAPATAAVGMLDAIRTVRKPYDDQNREAATAKARETLAADAAFAQLPPRPAGEEAQ